MSFFLSLDRLCLVTQLIRYRILYTMRFFLDPLNHNKNKLVCGCHHNLVLLVSDPYEAEFVLGVQFPNRGMGHFYEFLVLHSVELCSGDVHIWTEYQAIPVSDHECYYTTMCLNAPKDFFYVCPGDGCVERLNVKVVHYSRMLCKKLQLQFRIAHEIFAY